MRHSYTCIPANPYSSKEETERKCQERLFRGKMPEVVAAAHNQYGWVLDSGKIGKSQLYYYEIHIVVLICIGL